MQPFTHRELQQALWEVIAKMERARLKGDDDMALRLSGLLGGWLGRWICGE